MNQIENVIVRGEDGKTYTARDFNEEELNGVGGHSCHFWSKLNTIPKDIGIAEVIICEDVKTKVEEIKAQKKSG